MKTLEYIEKKVTESLAIHLAEIDETVAELLRTQIETLTAAALGFRKSSFGSGWEMPHDSSKSLLVSLFREKAMSAIQDLWSSHVEKIMADMPNQPTKYVKAFRTAYKESYHELLTEKVNSEAHRQAVTDVDVFFQALLDKHIDKDDLVIAAQEVMVQRKKDNKGQW